jgi:hypothetical protein
MARLTFLKHRSAVFVLVMAAAWGVWELFLVLTAPGRIDPALEPTLRDRAPVSVAITLGFTPENFHIRLFQSCGIVSGVQGRTVLVNRVAPEDLRRIAHYYWVERITLQSRSPG